MDITESEIQYKHDRHGSQTFAVITPSKSQLMTAVRLMKAKSPALVTFPLGVAKVHPKDQYCKRTGRVVSATKIKMVEGTLDALEMNQHGVNYIVSAGTNTVCFFRRHGSNYVKLDWIF
jgi:hypothetical protein